MANWKKVLVSGSDIVVGGITASNVPAGTSGGSAPDLVLTLNTDGAIRTVSQSTIQGTTVAKFNVSAQNGATVEFDATQDTLLITGSNGVVTTVEEPIAGTTLVGVNLPVGTISASSQVTLADTDGFTAFSASLAGELSASQIENISNTTQVSTIQAVINDLAISASNLITVSSSIASQISTNTDNITDIQGSVSSLNTFTSSVVVNSQTASFLNSASVVGTTNQISVTANGAQGIQIGLPENVTIGGTLEAGQIVIQGQNQQENQIATVSGSTITGNALTNIHQFTGSVEITGSLNLDLGGGNNFSIDDLPVNNSANIGGLVHLNTAGQLRRAGSNISTQISGAFTAFSASLAEDIANIVTSTTTDNSTQISNLQAVSASLVASQSAGIFFSASNGGESIGLSGTASFLANGDGLSVSVSDTIATNTVAITYAIDPNEIASAANAFSSSAQLQETLDNIYVPLADAPISGTAQLQALGFITASDFNALQNVPVGLISGAAASATQGQFTLNEDTVVSVPGLTAGGSPTFKNVTITNNLIVNGPTAELQVDELNIEDQFILINSGANGGDVDAERDGGIIVDQGDGTGALLMYDAGAQAWAFRGATDANKTAYNATSAEGGAVVPDVYVGTVNNSTGNPSAAPLYGTGDFQKGQMHVNTQDNTIWIYA